MTTVELEEELHANTRRSRITYRGRVNGEPAAIKCYRKPLFGVIHWLRAVLKGKKLRRVGGPVPPIVFSGWVASEKCFGFGTTFLEGYSPLRSILVGESSRSKQVEIVGQLGAVIADLHRRGIEQTDGNLTNFMMSDMTLVLIDEDDINVHAGELPRAIAVSNLANVAARLPDQELVDSLVNSYLRFVSDKNSRTWDAKAFQSALRDWRKRLDAKRASRNIAPRRFD